MLCRLLITVKTMPLFLVCFFSTVANSLPPRQGVFKVGSFCIPRMGGRGKGGDGGDGEGMEGKGEFFSKKDDNNGGLKRGKFLAVVSHFIFANGIRVFCNLGQTRRPTQVTVTDSKQKRVDILVIRGCFCFFVLKAGTLHHKYISIRFKVIKFPIGDVHFG